MLQTGHSEHLTFRVQRPDGGWRFLDTTGTAYRAADGETRGILVSRDVTAQRQAKEALRESQEQLLHAQKMEAIGRLAGGVAHDFNNLLTAITGYSALLIESLGADNPLRADVEEIVHAADQAASFTKQLLAFSRRQVLQPRVIDLNAARLQRRPAAASRDRRGHRVRDVPGQRALAREGGPGADRAADHESRGERARRHAPRRAARPCHLDATRARGRRLRAPEHPSRRLGQPLPAGQRAGNERPDARAHLRALLHHQGNRQGNRPRARHGLRDRGAERGPRPRGERARRGLDLQHLSAPRERAPGRGHGAAAPERPARHGDAAAGGGLRVGAAPAAALPREARLHGDRGELRASMPCEP